MFRSYRYPQVPTKQHDYVKLLAHLQMALLSKNGIAKSLFKKRSVFQRVDWVFRVDDIDVRMVYHARFNNAQHVLQVDLRQGEAVTGDEDAARW